MRRRGMLMALAAIALLAIGLLLGRDAILLRLIESVAQRWVAGGHTEPPVVHGPSGVAQVLAGFMQAYAMDQRRVGQDGDLISLPAARTEIHHQRLF